MSRRALVRIVLVVLILAGVAVIVLRDGDSLRNEWADCTAPQAQEALPVASENPRIDLDSELVGRVPDPVSMADAGDTLIVGSLTGEVTDLASDEVILDLTDEVLVGAEQGLLDVEFDPGRDWLYVSYTELPDGDSRVRAWPWNGSEELDPDDGINILALDQPHRWHNGGGIVFGPDGHLYMGLGDGGADTTDGTTRARDVSSMFGSIIRIDPTPESGGYEIPDDNPFAEVEGAAPEILHYGLRNPWRFSFDEDGRMWIADVGQFCVEEINVVEPTEAAVNFGWPGLEGTYEWAYPEEDDARPPVFEYLHVGFAEEKAVCSVSGGEVYRGGAIPALRGVYVFADLCDGGVRGIRIDDGTVVEYDIDLTIESPVAVISDDDGALYVASFQDGGSLFELVAG